MIGSPSPSQPTVRAVCPSTAVRQSASHTMRRLRPVRAQAAAAGGAPQRRQLAVRNAFPADTPAWTAWGQGPAHTALAAALQPTASLAGGRVPAGGRPPRPERLDHLHACLRAARCSARRDGLQAVPPRLWGRRCRAHGAGVLAAPRTAPLHAVDAEAIASRGHTRPGSRGAGAGQGHPRGARLPGGARGRGAWVAYQPGRIGVAVPRRPHRLRFWG
jgi:hypothetical protein